MRLRLAIIVCCLFPPPAQPAPQRPQPVWNQIAPGVEAAKAAELGGDPAWAAKVVLVDPERARFAVRYDPSRPTLAQWRERYPQALAIVNGSFYSTDGGPGIPVRPTCDLVTAGRFLRGAGCQRKDALFFGAQARPDDEAPHTDARNAPGPVLPQSRMEATRAAASPALARTKEAAAPLPAPRAPERPRLLAAADFRPERWSEAMKSFPALVHAGSASCGGPHYCAESSRTAAVAQLRDGRILLFASQWPAVRREVGRWLAEALGAVEALNLDGGPEATLALRGESLEEAIAARGIGLPLVLLLLPP